jgi:hypothetical protein
MPTAPAPMITSEPGRLSLVTAPVEEMIRFSSMVTPGSERGSEPVPRMTARRASRFWTESLPAASLPATSTRRGLLSVPRPGKSVILFLRNRNSTPLAMRSATLRERCTACA